MRYRRIRYRYAFVVAAGGGRRTAGLPRPVSEPWQAERPGVTLAQTCWSPAADVYETATTVTVTAELAGVDQDEIDVLLFEDALIVEGQRRLPPAGAAGVYHAAQIRQGPFRLELALPAPIDTEQGEAHYDRGLLTMTLIKRDRR